MMHKARDVGAEPPMTRYAIVRGQRPSCVLMLCNRIPLLQPSCSKLPRSPRQRLSTLDHPCLPRSWSRSTVWSNASPRQWTTHVAPTLIVGHPHRSAVFHQHQDSDLAIVVSHRHSTGTVIVTVDP